MKNQRRPSRRASTNSKWTAWRRAQLSAQIKRRFRNAVLGVVVVISTIILFLLLTLWQFLSTPLAEASEVLLHRPFDQDNRYTILLLLLDDREKETPVIESVTLLSVNPVDVTATMISVPSSLDLSEISNLGDVKLSSLYALGNVNKENNGPVRVVAQVLQKAMALEIDKYVVTDERNLKNMGGIVSEDMNWESFDSVFSFSHLPSILKLASSYKESVVTDFTFEETLRLLKFLLSVREDRINKLELSAGDMEDPRVLDEKLRDKVMDNNVFADRLSVQILNGTAVPGVAQQTARFVENMGGRVVGVGNTKEQASEVSFLLARDVDDYTVKRLANLFQIDEIRPFDEAYGIRDRADITLVIGLDLARRL